MAESKEIKKIKKHLDDDSINTTHLQRVNLCMYPGSKIICFLCLPVVSPSFYSTSVLKSFALGRDGTSNFILGQRTLFQFVLSTIT